MTLFDLLFAYAMTIAIGVLMLFMPALSRGSTFFAVTVPDGFASSELGRAIHRRYLGITGIATLVAPAVITPASWWLSDDVALGLAYGIGPLLPVIGGLAAFVHCRGIALHYRREQPTAREASLARERLVDIVPGRWWMHAGPYALLLAAAGWLVLRWQAIPDPAFVPMNLPDGEITARTLLAVFGLPLAMAATLALCHAMMALGLLIRRLPGHRRRVRSINAFILGVLWLTAIVGAYDSLAVLYGERWITGPVGMLVNVGSVVAILVLPIWIYATGRFARPGEPAQGDRSPDDAWKLGLVYFNPDDPTVWVEKRFGVGYTLNFARVTTWLILLAFLALTAGLLAWSFSLG
jgi:hypothetical protein